MTTTCTLPRPAVSRTPKSTRPAGALARIFFAIDRPLKVWEKRLRDRAQLRSMPDHLLRDVGIDIATAREEAEKPFWQA